MRKILHLSDVHFGPPHRPDVARAVHELAERREPDLVVISGDLTQRARSEQFQAARRWVDQFAAPTLSVPGNHDVPMYRVHERVFSPYGAYRKYFSEVLEPEYRDPEICVFGVNSAHGWTVKEGRIRRARLRKLEEQLASTPAGAARIVVVHHQLVPAPRFGEQRVLRNAFETVDLLSRGGADLVLSGHLHQAFLADSEAFYPAGRRNVPILHSGTSTSSRGRGWERGQNTCNWVELDEAEIRIEHLFWDRAASELVEQSRHVLPRSPRGT